MSKTYRNRSAKNTHEMQKGYGGHKGWYKKYASKLFRKGNKFLIRMLKEEK